MFLQVLLFFLMASVISSCFFQIVLLKDKKKVFTLDNLGYEAEVGVIHPGGTTAAVGGAVSVHLKLQIIIGDR